MQLYVLVCGHCSPWLHLHLLSSSNNALSLSASCSSQKTSPAQQKLVHGSGLQEINLLLKESPIALWSSLTLQDWVRLYIIIIVPQLPQWFVLLPQSMILISVLQYFVALVTELHIQYFCILHIKLHNIYKPVHHGIGRLHYYFITLMLWQYLPHHSTVQCTTLLSQGYPQRRKKMSTLINLITTSKKYAYWRNGGPLCWKGLGRTLWAIDCTIYRMLAYLYLLHAFHTV